MLLSQKKKKKKDNLVDKKKKTCFNHMNIYSITVYTQLHAYIHTHENHPRSMKSTVCIIRRDGKKKKVMSVLCDDLAHYDFNVVFFICVVSAHKSHVDPILSFNDVADMAQ